MFRNINPKITTYINDETRKDIVASLEQNNAITEWVLSHYSQEISPSILNVLKDNIKKNKDIIKLLEEK